MRYWSRRPGTLLLAVVTLALGLGAATTFFAALWSVVLRPLPYADPGRLVVIRNRIPEANLLHLPASLLDYGQLSARPDIFSGVGGYYFLDLTRTGIEHAQRVNAVAATRTLLAVLDVKPILGRYYSGDETDAILLSESYWTENFARDPTILNRTIQLDGKNYTVSGVMPASFVFPNDVTQMWVPLNFRPAQLTDGMTYYLRTVARLRPGLSAAAAETAIAQLSREYAQVAPANTPRARAGWSMFLSPLASDENQPRRSWATMLFGSVMLLWAIVCWNFASLLLVRWNEQRFELALRTSLGASRSGLAFGVFREAIVLSALGGIGGLAAAYAGVALLTRYGSAGTILRNGAAGTISMEPPVYWFCAALTVLTGILSGMYPAWSAARGVALEAIQAGGHQHTTSVKSRRWQQMLIVAEVAAATVLLVLGGSLVKSVLEMLKADPGFDPRHLTTVEVSLPKEQYKTPEQRWAFAERAFGAIRALPGVTGASACTLLPFGYGENINTFEIIGKPKPQADPFADMNFVWPDYFETMHIRLLKGRAFEERDHLSTRRITVIDQTMADKFFPGEDPIGRQIRTSKVVFEVVGVVNNVRVAALDQDPAPQMYFPVTSEGLSSIVIRTREDVPGLVNQVAGAIAGIDRDRPIYNIFPMEALVDRSVRFRRFVAWLVSVFAISGVLLSSAGTYSVLAYTVQLRRREIGIRMAVGASNRRIAAWIAKSGAAVISTGLILGVLASIAGERILRTQIAEIRFADFWVWTALLTVLAVAGALACAAPAWRASRIHPADSLK
jgi:predicted permease